MRTSRQISGDDPKLTAYVVGELHETARKELEQRLAHSPELRREAEEIRAIVSALRTELGAGRSRVTGSAKSGAQTFCWRDHSDRSGPAEKILHFPNRRLVAAAVFAIAASIALVMTWQFWIAMSPHRMIAKLDSPRSFADYAARTRAVVDPQFAAVFRDVAYVAYNLRGLDSNAPSADTGLRLDLFRPGRLPRESDLSAHTPPDMSEAGFTFTVRYQREF
jgi:anti-sigma factor RsiW